MSDAAGADLSWTRRSRSALLPGLSRNVEAAVPATAAAQAPYDHAIFGSLSRMIAILLEHHGGVLPFWLSPDQVAVAPISKDQAGYGADVLAAFEDAGDPGRCL